MSGVLELPTLDSVERIYDAMEIARTRDASIMLSNVSWKAFDDFVDNNMGKVRRPFLYYESGSLFIMTIGSFHERIKETITYLINLLCEEFQIESLAFGSTTCRREDIERGFEPDACFYIANELEIRGVRHLDLSIHPPPDLIVEVDITSLSSFRESIFSAFGVPEIWRYDGEKVSILALNGDKYIEVNSSISLPLVSADRLSAFVEDSQKLGRLEWSASVRDRVISTRNAVE